MQLPLFDVSTPTQAKAAKTKPTKPRSPSNSVPTTPVTTPSVASLPNEPQPQTIIQRVIEVLGAIDLDPYSTSSDVPAKQRYTVEEQGLNQSWQGRVWLNPPTNRAIQSWIEKLHKEYEHGDVTAAIALLPARTNAIWWQKKLGTYPFCAIGGKIEYVRTDGRRMTNNSACVAIYLGQQLSRFARVFSAIGTIYIPYIG